MLGHWGMRSHRRTGHFGTLGHEVSQEDGTFWDTQRNSLPFFGIHLPFNNMRFLPSGYGAQSRCFLENSRQGMGP